MQGAMRANLVRKARRLVLAMRLSSCGVTLRTRESLDCLVRCYPGIKCQAFESAEAADERQLNPNVGLAR
jgi:hypothetical protein